MGNYEAAKQILENLKKIEKEVQTLCDHESWGAAEGANNRAVHQIEKLKSF